MSEEVLENVESSIEESTESEAISNDSLEVQAQSEDELKEEALENGASKKEVQNMIKEFHLKVNGRDFVKKLDLSNEEDIKRELQLALAGRHALEDKAKTLKMYEQDIEFLKKDPMAALQNIGLDPEEIAVRYLQKKVEEQEEASKKTPEQVEKEQLSAKLKELELEIQRREEAAAEQERQRLDQESQLQLNDEMIEAIDSDPDLPKNPRVMQELARAMIWAYRNGETNIKAKDMVPTVKYKLQKDLNELFSALSDDGFEKFAGKSNLDRIRNKRIEKIKAQPKSPLSVKDTGRKEEAPKERKKVNLDDFLRGF